MKQTGTPQVVISAGFNKTHVTTAAREALDHGQLALAITGAYPAGRLNRVVRRAGLTGRGPLARLVERDEQISRERLRVHALPELLFGIARLPAQTQHAEAVSQRLCAGTFRLYGWMAGRELRRLRLDGAIYHFRAGFGGSSIKLSRELGMHVLCDHAIAHPAVLDALVASRGQLLKLSTPAASLGRPGSMSPLDRTILADIDQSDRVVVNSDFVKRTFLECGWPADRVHVIDLGVDENFLRMVRRDPRQPDQGVLRLLFAGRFERRKGADVIVGALSQLPVPWRLVIAGPVTHEVRVENHEFLADPRVHVLGSIRRSELAQEMAAASVFVFPSYAEGSARVVFEALASGCYVITTPNSGTIVEDRVHGALIPPGDIQALVDAITDANADRQILADIGNKNAALIRERFRQRDYGEALSALYSEIAGSPLRAAVAL